jgi:D-amino peptidase
MKILILTDLEGVAGVSVEKQLGDISNPYYRKAREMLADEINAAVTGAKEAGATEFLVADGHGSGYDMMLDFDRIDQDVKFITGCGSSGENVMDAVDDSFAAAFVIGQHPKKGSRGALEHTGSHLVNQGMRLNDIEVGEAGFHAAVLGEKNIPLALLTGDDEAVREMTTFAKNGVGVAVKKGISRNFCISLHPLMAQRMIKDGACRAVRAVDNMTAWRLSPPFSLTIKYGASAFAEKYAPLDVSKEKLFPYITRVNENTICISAKTMCELNQRYHLINRVV